MFTSMRIRICLLALGALAAPTAVHADYVSATIMLDQSNSLKDGVAYGSVLVEAYNGIGAAGGGLKAGEVRLTYSALVASDYDHISKTFGIDHLGFNTDLKLKAKQITPPSGWKISSTKTLSGFGKFSWDADGSAKGGSRPDSVSLLITGLGAKATLDHFLIGSTGSGKNPPSEGSVYFAMHVAGFTTKNDCDVTSHWVGGSTRVILDPPPPEGSGDVPGTPEPAGIILGAVGFGGICIGRSWRRRK